MVRVAAWWVLRSGSETPMREIDRAVYERGLDDRDRGLLRRIIGTEVRRRATLRAIVKAFSHHKLKPDLLAHLHLGIAQLLFLDRVPDHAAVSETLGAVHETIGQSKVRVVNAILRNVARAREEGLCGDPTKDLVGVERHMNLPVFHDPVEHPLLWAEDALSVPATLMKRWQKRYGRERAEELARYGLDEPPLAVHGVGIAPEEVGALLEGAGIEARAGVHPACFVVPAASTGELTSLQSFAEGKLTIQGETALAAAELVGAREGERVLDLCAAPGGKTAVLASTGANVLAADLNSNRLKRLNQNMERLGLADRVRTVCSDGTASIEEGGFDAVLVDAPCSNTGVLAARPGARWRFGPKNQKELTELQARLLSEGAERVRPGGRLVWSTCSLESEENARQVRTFLEGNEGWKLGSEAESLPGPTRSGGEGDELVHGPTDGGYHALMIREG